MADELAVEVKWPDSFPVRAANVFRVSRHIDEVEVVFGYLPLARITDFLGKETGHITTEPQSPRAISMSSQAFRSFRNQVNQIYDMMVKAEIFEEESNADDED